MWHNMISFRNLQDEVGSIVLNFLKSVDKVSGTAIEKRVKEVESGHRKGENPGRRRSMYGRTYILTHSRPFKRRTFDSSGF